MQHHNQHTTRATPAVELQSYRSDGRGPLIYPSDFDQTGVAFAHIRAGKFWQHIDTNNDRMAQVGPHYAKRCCSTIRTTFIGLDGSSNETHPMRAAMDNVKSTTSRPGR